MSTPEISQVLAQMRVLAAQAGAPAVNESSPAKGGSFQQLLTESIGKVNDLQQQASSLKTAFERGDDNVDLAQVMIATQKAGLAFTAMAEVRNKLVDAYRDVMNMPL
ncbi:MAG: flagellar hook-basal body complex protein FliE [Gammaproteobacteria bacterium]|nr:MAG: flagellar hook-basal body complex protein FliE [Gammaproteobacteria bacterium]